VPLTAISTFADALSATVCNVCCEGEEAEMSAIPHKPSVESRFAWLRITEMWASLAITVMWLAVLFDAIFAPDIISNTPGGTSSSVPSAVAVALFATIGTWAVAKHGLHPREHD
jgi:hypothetical protein